MGVAMAVFVVGCRFVDELFWVCGGLPIWVLGGDGGVLWMSCSGLWMGLCCFVVLVTAVAWRWGSFGFGFGLWGWKNGFGVGGLWCFGGGSGWSVVAGVGVLMLVNLEC
uniref:Transmembrane protein n=1 Tax=Fagus sylvatica TaxID=28930 RepID=A0A2N9GCR8_FAGSY